jgi:PAS domain S-box-containing protein
MREVTVAHEAAIPELAAHLRPIFEESPDGVYVWLDEEHAMCNARLAAMFGLSVEAWAAEPGFLQRFVHEDDQGLFSWNYWNRVRPHAFPVTFRFRGIRSDGSTFAAETDMIPLTYGGHTVAYHFVRTVGD